MENARSPHASDALLCFQWSIQALAQEASVQQDLFPSYVCVADELALDFDEALRRVRPLERVTEFNPEQVALIKDLDKKLERMSGPQNEELWTDEALATAPEWMEVRAVAGRVLDVMKWPKTAPPADRAIYVGPDA